MSGNLSSIYNNISFALYLHSEAMTRLQEQASTGSRINRASDDPSAAHQVLGLNSQQKSLGNYTNNISEAISTLELSSTVIDDMMSVFAEKRAHLTQIVGGTYGEEGRDGLAEAIDDALEQIVSLASTKRMGQYFFGGSNTSSAPYLVERTNGEITSVTYQGSSESRNIEVAPGVQSSVFYAGDDIFRSNSRSAPTFLGDTGAKAGTGTSSVRGDVWLEITQPGGPGTPYRLSIDDDPTSYTEVTVPPGDANTMVTHADTGEVLYVDTTGITGTGVDMVRMPGTYDIFDTLISVRDILKNERELSGTKLMEAIKNSIGSLEEVHNLLVQKSVSIGSKIGFLDNLKDSFENIKFNAEDEITRLQEADIAQIAIDLSRREVLYQMSLSVAGKLMSISLLDFLE